MKRILHYGAVLMIIAVISAGILAYSNKKTEGAIKNISIKLENEARKSVFKEALKFEKKEKKEVSEVEYVPAYGKTGVKIGYIAKVKTQGYGGNIVIVMGINSSKKITGIKIIESKETPGLGDKILNEKWQEKWIGRDKSYEFNKREDAFAGATISPRAVYSGIKKSLDNYPENSSQKKSESDYRVEILSGAVKLAEEKQELKSSEGYKFIPGLNEKGETVGCVVSCTTNGYNGVIKFDMGITTEGKIAGLKITESSETGGLGGIIEEKKWQDMWKGRDSKYEFNEELDAKAGATVSPRAVYKEMTKALSAYESMKK